MWDAVRNECLGETRLMRALIRRILASSAVALGMGIVAVFSTPFPIAGNSKQIPTLGRGKYLVESVAIHILDSPYQSLIGAVCVAHEQQYQDHADERNEPGHNHYRVE